MSPRRRDPRGRAAAPGTGGAETASARASARASRRDRADQAAHDDGPRLARWAALCFLLSGAAGLLYEVVWSKELARLLGNTLHSVAAVVTAFLAGLAIGAVTLGPRLARRRRGARDYAFLEIGIAVLGLASIPVLHGLDPVIGALHQALGGAGVLFQAARFVLLFVLLLPPTLLMGATLPVLVAHFEYRAVGPALARLYAVNTAGAVAGSLLGGFALVPGIGLQATTAVAAALNAAAAAIAFVLGQGAARARGAAEASVAARPEGSAALPAPTLPANDRRMVAVLFALSGLAALAFQMAWVRLFGLLFGSSVYSFAGVLAVYLLGLAGGSALVARALSRETRLLGAFARLELAIAAVCFLSMWVFPLLPELLFRLMRDAGGSWETLYLGQLGLIALVLLVPCLLFGAVFPIAARLLQTRDGGHATGSAYAINTLGTITGTLLAGFVLIPALGVRGTHAAAAALSAWVGVAALMLAAPRRELSAGRVVVLIVFTLAAGVAGLASPRWDPAVMSAGMYRPREAEAVARYIGEEGAPVHRAKSLERVLFYREGINGSVYVGSDSADTYRSLRVGGKVDASTGDMVTQVLLGLVPAACAKQGGRACVIGLGSGVTASSALAGGMGQVDVVEIEPAVVEASRFFHAAGQHPLDDRRTRLILTDGRTHLAYAPSGWDMVVSEPSNPWIAGINDLFTVDFYRLVRSRLAPGGVFCQWVPLYELSKETLSSLLASYLSVFPTGHAFLIERGDLLLVAMPEDAVLPRERLRGPAVAREIERARLLSPEAVGAFYLCPFDSLVPLVAGAPLNRDDLPVVEYRAPRDMYRIGTESLGQQRLLLPFRDAGWASARRLLRGWPPEEYYGIKVRQLVSHGDPERALATAEDARTQGFVDLGAALAHEVRAFESRRGVVQQHTLARAAAMAGRHGEARAALLRAVGLDSTDARTWVLLAETERQLGNAAAARAAAARGMALGGASERSDAEIVLGIVSAEAGDRQGAAAHFRAAQRWNPTHPDAYRFEVQILREAGDSTGAIAAARRGLVHRPADPALLGVVEGFGTRR